MSAMQVQAVIDQMDEADRLFAAAYLKHLARRTDASHRTRLGSRLRRMAGGKKVSLAAVKRLHKQLEAAGL